MRPKRLPPVSSTSDPLSSWSGEGLGNQISTIYPVNCSYNNTDMLPPLIPSLTPSLSLDLAAPFEPMTSSISVDERALPLIQSNSAMATGEPQYLPNAQPQQVRKRKRVSINPRYSTADWNRHRSAIKELYMDRDLSLEDTMKEMSARGFKPSSKKYKEKLKEWRFVKNVPRDVVRWMFYKAEQRSRPDPEHPKGKDTLFEYGESSLTIDDVRKRFERAHFDLDKRNDIDAPTPKDVVYQTPRAMASSPPAVRQTLPSNSTGSRWTTAPPRGPQVQYIPPTFNNHTLADFEAMEREARLFESKGDLVIAEEMYREALTGFEKILSPTHESANTLAYHLASFYADCNRMDEADRVLSSVAEKHIGRWGVDHFNTMEHFLHVSRLYNSWSRNDEALSILYRILDTWDGNSWNNTNIEDPTYLGARRKENAPRAVPRRMDPFSESNQAPGVWAETDDPVRVDYQLGLVNTRLSSCDDTAENTLLLLIDQCENHRQRLSPQILRARCTLVNLYRRQGDDEKALFALRKAREEVERVFQANIKKTENLLKACIEVGELHLREHDDETAEAIFQSIAAEAEDAFSMDEQAPTIMMIIRIGNIYQTENDWNKAEPWFEHALAASLAVNGTDSQLTKALSTALEDRHYSSELLLGKGSMTFSLDELRRIKFLM